MAERVVEISYQARAEQASAETRKLDQQIDGLGKTSKTATTESKIGLEGMQKSLAQTGSSAATNLGKVQTELSKINDAISKQRKLLESQQRGLIGGELRNDTARVEGFRQRIAATEQEIGRLTAAKISLTQQAGRLGKSTELTGGIFNTFTTRINTGRGALRGYDAAIESVVRSFGGVSVAFALGLQLLATLGPVLFDLISKKKELVKIDEDLIATDLALLDVQERLAVASGNATPKLSQQAATSIDLVDILEKVADASDTVSSATKEVSIRQAALEQIQVRGISSLRQFGDGLSRTEVNQAALTAATQRASDVLAGANQKRLEAQSILDDNIVVLLNFQRATGASNEAIISMARASAFTSDQIATLTARLDAGAAAALEFARALRSVQIARLEVDATSEGIAQQRRQLGQRIAGQEAAGQDRTTILLSNADALAKLNKSIEQNVIATARMKGETLSQTELQRRVNIELQKAPDFVNQYGRAQLGLENVIEKSNRSSSRAATAARNQAAALNNLTKQIQEAEAALEGDTFRRREAKILADIEAQRRTLAINKRLNVEAQNELATIQRLQLEKLNKDRLEAARQIEVEIKRIQIEGIKDEESRKIALANFEVEQKRRSLLQAFGNEKVGADLVDQFQRAKVLEFIRWRLEQMEKLNNELIKLGQRAAEAENERLLQSVNSGVDSVLQSQVAKGAVFKSRSSCLQNLA